MKRTISKIMLAALVVGSMPVHSDFKSGIRSMLQWTGNNPGWMSLAISWAGLSYAAMADSSDKIRKARTYANNLKI